MRHLFFAACFFEAGLLLIVLPWTVLWDRNSCWPRFPISSRRTVRARGRQRSRSRECRHRHRGDRGARRRTFRSALARPARVLSPIRRPRMTLARRRPIVMLVTNRARLAERVGATPNDLESVTPHLLSQIESAAAAGVTVIQLREPALEARALARLTRAAMRAARERRRRSANGVDVALAGRTASLAGARSAVDRGEPCCRSRRWWARQFPPRRKLDGRSLAMRVWHDHGRGRSAGRRWRLDGEACRRRIGHSGPGDWRCHAGADL